jgi:hypothetical protein
LVENNYDVQLREHALANITQDRKVLEPILIHILEFAKKNTLLISNVDMLLDTVKFWEKVEIYAVNADAITKELAIDLCKKFDRIFQFRVLNEGLEYTIDYNLRNVCIINAIRPYRNFTLYDFILPVKHQALGVPVYLLPYLPETIYLYKQLYDPNEAGNWEDRYKDIKSLENLVDKEINTYVTMSKKKMIEMFSSSPTNMGIDILDEKNGGSDDECPTSCNSNPTKSSKSSKSNKTINIDNIKHTIIDFFSKNEHPKIFCTEDVVGPIEMISATPELDFTALVAFLSKFVSFKLSIKKKSLYLPKEHQMEKYHVYVNVTDVKKTRKHIMTIYNNLSYELINYYESRDIKYADPITQIRFLYISIWTGLITQNTHGLQYETFREFVKRIKILIDKNRKLMDLYTTKTHYVGMYLPLTIQKKILALNTVAKRTSFYCHNI